MPDLTPEKLAELRRLLDAPPQHITIARDDALALLDAAAERDALAAAVERVRVLHGPRVVQVLGPVCFAEECDHEDACPLVDYTVCGHCYDVGDVAHPCATIRALGATQTGGES